MESNSGGELTLRDLTIIYRRRRKVIYGAVAVLFSLAAIYCVLATRRYEATETIQVQGKSQDGLGLETLTGGAAENDTDALAANMNIQTQANILQSETLALKTIEDLHLEDTPDFKPRWSPIGWAMGLLSSPGVSDPPHASLEDSPQRRRRVIAVFNRFLTVKAVSGTRLLSISYLSSDPKMAAAVVNKLTESLIDFSYQAHFNATNQASSWLGGQLDALRKQSEDLHKQLADAENKSGIYNLGTVDPLGHAQSYSGVLDQLQQASTALALAEQNRILRGAIADAADKGDAEALSNLAGNTTAGATMNNTLGLIQNLRGQEATAQAALQQAEAKYGTSYPKLVELRASLVGLQHSIQLEIQRLKQRAKSDYQVAATAEEKTRAQYDKLRTQADTMNNKSVDLGLLRQEAEQSAKLYQDLRTKFNEAGVLQGLKGSTITVVDPGRIPGKPKKPNVPLYLGGSLAGAFVLGCCLALMVDIMDSSIHTIGEVERISGGNLLGITPFYKAKPDSSSSDRSRFLASEDDPESAFVQAVRAIRTAIFLRGSATSCSVILVTSSVAGEGKTVISANLAALMGQAGKKVLLIDTDFREGALRTVFDLPSKPGLAELLAGQVQQPEILSVPSVPNLDALQAGSSQADSSGMLSSMAFVGWLSAWRAKYDYIVLDSTSLLPGAEPLALAPLSDVALLVGRPGLTEKSQLTRSYQLLTQNSSHFVGTILNGLRPGEDGYSSYFGSGKLKHQ